MYFHNFFRLSLPARYYENSMRKKNGFYSARAVRNAINKAARQGSPKTGSFLYGKERAGAIPAEDFSPAVRDLAAEAGVNPNTMQRALAQLEQDGLAKADRTAGRLVTQDEAVLERARRAEAQGIIQSFLEAMGELGYSPSQAAALLKEENEG